MEINLITEHKKQFIDLLLLADEQESMIDNYLARGDLFALYDNGLKSVCVVTGEGPGTCELKNIATYERWYGMGYGSRLIAYVSAFYKGKYKTMLVGTGEVPWILRFYEKNGFALSHRVPNFFTDNYDHPIFDSGVRLVDMIYLKKELDVETHGSASPPIKEPPMLSRLFYPLCRTTPLYGG
jgi:GNAT superfamily N-acetyltransferase